MEKITIIGYDEYMPRNYVTQGIIFSIKPAGENNSSVGFMTKDNGVVYATLYGGPKSRLRSLVSLWNSGTAYLYCKENGDITKNVKITDFDVQNYHLSFRENLYKNYAASLAAELAVKTKCAGSYEKCWYLVSGFLDGLELSCGCQCETGMVRFLWRYLDLLGVRPDVTGCCECGGSVYTGNSAEERVSYNPVDNGFVCASCAGRDASLHAFTLSAEAVRYLCAVSELQPAEVRTIPLSADSLCEIKRLVFFLAGQAAGSKLKTIETGTVIL
jgi:DNA repair protein RecO (recombination protein O)